MKITFEKIIEKINYVNSFSGKILLMLLAGFGYIFGSVSLMVLFSEKGIDSNIIINAFYIIMIFIYILLLTFFLRLYLLIFKEYILPYMKKHSKKNRYKKK